MKLIVNYINRQCEKQGDNPLFLWLKDATIPPRERLTGLAKNTAFIAMSIGDLNKHIYPYPDPRDNTDPHKAEINEHALEDGNHWRYYISDIKQLGIGEGVSLGEILQEMLWNPNLSSQRKMIYKVAHLMGENDNPFVRYAIIECFEIFGKFMMMEASKVADILMEQQDIQLTFFGRRHLEWERDHIMEEDGEEDDLWDVELDDELREQCMQAVEQICPLMVDIWTEVGDAARTAYKNK